MAFKKITLQFFHSNNQIINEIFQIFTEKYWTKKNDPPFAEAYTILNDYLQNTPSFSKITVFRLKFPAIIFRETVSFSRYSEIPALNQALNNCKIQTYHNFDLTSTDTSKISGILIMTFSGNWGYPIFAWSFPSNY